jgi:diaminopimelate epimerase
MDRGRRFYKMSGSGNDFIVFDARSESASGLDEPAVVQALCARGSGVGADGVVFLECSELAEAHVRMRYLNRDGSRAAACGNATLCVTRLAAELRAAPADGMRVETDTGVLQARMVGELPEVELAPVREVRRDAGLERRQGEHRIGFALAGVPHLVVLCADADSTDVVGRGAPLRRDASLGPAGANVNFVSAGATGGVFTIRTYERGVEAETLACGTGAIATAVLLHEWDECGTEARLATRSGRQLVVRLERDGDAWIPTLRGEGRLVYTGELGEP